MEHTATATDAPSPLRNPPDRYIHWRLEVEPPVARLIMDVEEDAACVPATPEAQQLRPGRRHRAGGRDPAAALRASRGARRGGDQRQGPRLLLGREHLHARDLDALVQGQLLQVHERDAAVARGRVGALGPQVAGGRERSLRRRRRTSWRSRATRSCWSTMRRSAVSLPEVPLLGGAARHRRAHARDRQAQGARATWPTCSRSLGEGVKGKRAVQWRLVDETVPLSRFAQRVPERAKALAETGAARAAGPASRSSRWAGPTRMRA